MDLFGWYESTLANLCIDPADRADITVRQIFKGGVRFYPVFRLPPPNLVRIILGGRCLSCLYVGFGREWGFVLFVASRTYAIRQSGVEAGILTFYLYPHLIPPKEAGCPRGIVPHQKRLAHGLNPGLFQPVLQL